MTETITETKTTTTTNINVRVVSQDGTEVVFLIKPTTRMSKLMSSYCERQGIERTNLRFLFDGQRLLDNQTAKDLEMQENDLIDVVVAQIGGFK